jgi:iron complex outermembrane receptor protein
MTFDTCRLRIATHIAAYTLAMVTAPLSVSAQQAAQPAPAQPSELPPLEVTAKAAQKKAPAKKSQAKAATKAAPQAQPAEIAAPSKNLSGLPSGVAPVQNYVAQDAATGTKTDTPLRETPQSISVVGAEQIRDQGARTLQETLRYVPGVLADPYGADSRGDYAFIRGITAAKYLDGLRTGYGYYVNEAAIDPFTLERVEVLRGPSSMLYGQSTTGGIVNAVSKRPSAETHREITVEYGSFDFKQVKVDMTGPITTDGKWLYRVVGAARDADTQVDFVENDRVFIAPSITYKPTNDTSITVQTSFNKSQSGSVQQFLPRQGTLEANPITGKRISRSSFHGEPGDYYDTDAQSVSLLLDHKLSDGLSFHHISRYTHTENSYESTYPAVLSQSRIMQLNYILTAGGSTTFPLDLGDAPYMNSTQDWLARARIIRFTETDVLNGDTHLTGEFNTGPIWHKVTAGHDFMDYDASGKRSNTLLDNIPFLGQTPYDPYNPTYGQTSFLIDLNTLAPFDGTLHAFGENQINHGIYVQDQLKLGRWTAVLGLRQDWLHIDGLGYRESSDEEATTGRAGLMYAFDFGLTPYVTYSTSFTPQPGNFVRASPSDTTLIAAKPLEGEQVEVGFKYQTPGLPFVINAAVYELTETNRIIQPEVISDPLQGADAKVRGFEFEAAGQLTRELKIIGSYAYTDSEYTRYEYFPHKVGAQIEGVPKHQASLWGIYTFNDGWAKGLSLGAGVRYVGETSDVGTQLVGPTYTTTEIFTVKNPSYTLLDAMVSYETDDWRWQLTAQNLEDKEVITSCTADRGDCFIGQARTIITGFTYKF